MGCSRGVVLKVTDSKEEHDKLVVAHKALGAKGCAARYVADFSPSAMEPRWAIAMEKFQVSCIPSVCVPAPPPPPPPGVRGMTRERTRTRRSRRRYAATTSPRWRSPHGTCACSCMEWRLVMCQRTVGTRLRW